MEPRFKKHKIPMGLFALLILAGAVLFLGAAAVGEAVVGGMLIGVAVIAVAVVCWKMGQRGFYAEWEFQTPVVHPEGCRCQECLPPRHPEGCQCHECLVVEYPTAQTGYNGDAEPSTATDKAILAVNGREPSHPMEKVQ